MGAISECGVHVAALGAGLLGVCLGNGGGAVDASIGAAGLIGFVLGKNAQFGPECGRIQKAIEKEVRRSFAPKKGSVEATEVEAAADALQRALGACIIDRAALVRTAVTPEGFPKAAVAHVMVGLAQAEPELFGEKAKQHGAVTYRFASAMVEAAITSAIGNRQYYEQLEPQLILEMASALGRLEAKQDHHTALLNQILAAVSKTPEKQQAEDAGVTAEQFRALAETAMQKATTPQDALDYFTSLIDYAKEEAKSRKQPRNIDEFLQRVLDKANAFIEKSQREKADAEFDKALRQIEDEEENTKQRKRVVLDRAIDNDILRLELATAADRITARTALDLVEGQTLFATLRAVQGEWYTLGLTHGSRLALDMSVALAEKTVAIAQGGHERGMALVDLGISCAVLGERGEGPSSAEALSNAIAAYENALKVYTQKDMPADWAMTQNNLGNVYRTLGERGEGKAAADALAKSVGAFENALKVRTQKGMPAQWATTQNNLGNVYQALGQRREGKVAADALAKSVAAYEHALKVRTQKDMPADWAATQNNLGNVYATLGERGEGKAAADALAKAVAAYENALKVYTQKDMPADWAMTQNNLGNVHLTLGERGEGKAAADVLAKSVAAFENALKVFTQNDMPARWATTQNNLGNVCSTLGSLGEGKAAAEALAKSVAAYENALQVRTQKDMPADWAMTKENLAIVCLTVAKKQLVLPPQEALNKARAAVLEALTVYQQPGMEFYLTKAKRLLSRIDAALADLA